MYVSSLVRQRLRMHTRIGVRTSQPQRPWLRPPITRTLEVASRSLRIVRSIREVHLSCQYELVAKSRLPRRWLHPSPDLSIYPSVGEHLCLATGPGVAVCFCCPRTLRRRVRGASLLVHFVAMVQRCAYEAAWPSRRWGTLSVARRAEEACVYQ